MIYVFDTNSISHLKHLYPTVFKSAWVGLSSLAKSGNLISTKEVQNELINSDLKPHVSQWLKEHNRIFTTPSNEELQFVTQIFQVSHFRSLIGEKQTLKGTPVADPFVIACAKIHSGTVVTEEVLKPYAAKIPNVCAHFKINCINLETFMGEQNWSF